MKNKSALIICSLFLLLFTNDAECQELAKVRDFNKLSTFYVDMGKMYEEIKGLTDDLLKGNLTADAYADRMSLWKDRYDEKGSEAPCPKNNWRKHYAKLNPIHYDICFAWADLGALHTSLLMTDKDMIIFHENSFRKLNQDILNNIKNPEPKKLKDDF